MFIDPSYTADDVVHYLLYHFAYLIMFACNSLLYLRWHSTVLLSRQGISGLVLIWGYTSLIVVRQGARVPSTDVPGRYLTCGVPHM